MRGGGQIGSQTRYREVENAGLCVICVCAMKYKIASTAMMIDD